MKNKNGITLIALIITIIVMLILVGVTINFALNGGIINKAKEATIQMEIAQIQEQLMLKKAEILADNNGNIPTAGYGLTSIADLDGLSESTVSKYNSKLTISSDGTLYYLEDKVSGEEKVYFENAGIRAYQEQEPTSSSIYNASYVYTYEELGGITTRYVFLENGTYIYTLGITGISPALTYSISGNTITFADPDMDGTTHTMTISDDLTQLTLDDDNITFSRDQENFFIDSAENKTVDSDTGMYLNSIYKGTNDLYIAICDGTVTIYSKLGAIGDRSEATYCSLSEAISDKGFIVNGKTITYNDVVYTLVESESDIITN